MNDDLFQFLKDDPGINSIFAARIFHEFLPQDIKTYPAMTFQLLSSIEVAQDMDDDDSERLDESRWQIDIYARKSGAVIDAARQFDSIFRVFRGTMGATLVAHIERSNESHLGEVIGDKQSRRISLDYAVTHSAI